MWRMDCGRTREGVSQHMRRFFQQLTERKGWGGGQIERENGCDESRGMEMERSGGIWMPFWSRGAWTWLNLWY